MDIIPSSYGPIRHRATTGAALAATGVIGNFARSALRHYADRAVAGAARATARAAGRAFSRSSNRSRPYESDRDGVGSQPRYTRSTGGNTRSSTPRMPSFRRARSRSVRRSGFKRRRYGRSRRSRGGQYTARRATTRNKYIPRGYNRYRRPKSSRFLRKVQFMIDKQFRQKLPLVYIEGFVRQWSFATATQSLTWSENNTSAGSTISSRIRNFNKSVGGAYPYTPSSFDYWSECFNINPAEVPLHQFLKLRFWKRIMTIAYSPLAPRFSISMYLVMVPYHMVRGQTANIDSSTPITDLMEGAVGNDISTWFAPKQYNDMKKEVLVIAKKKVKVGGKTTGNNASGAVGESYGIHAPLEYKVVKWNTSFGDKNQGMSFQHSSRPNDEWSLVDSYYTLYPNEAQPMVPQVWIMYKSHAKWASSSEEGAIFSNRFRIDFIDHLWYRIEQHN